MWATPTTVDSMAASRFEIDMDRTHFTSDTHFGHARIAELAGRPEPDVDAMNDQMVNDFNRIVPPDNDVWMAGDTCLGQIAESLPVAGRLNGRKRQTPGNHDRTDPWNPKPGGSLDRAGWEAKYQEVAGIETIQGPIELVLDGTVFVFCHYPYEGDSQEVDRFADRQPEFNGRPIIHGHVHEAWRVRMYRGVPMVNVGVDAWGGKPVSAWDVMAAARAGVDAPPLEWA